ncbi:hypothetical protein [Aureimonas leprariae]|uniref:Uncharacterized protein n=1 Tax=Plantimonas leprariae TaxID=2615207 RepID=A0A7V7PSM5_9HYPH|nr:hypothetical protein [Aureimonas leprariae]KAB0682541.1 hypothetical protein F6X38_00155 [Aureimonas leprariae]
MPFRIKRPAPAAAALILALSGAALAQQPSPGTAVPEVPSPAQPDNNGGSTNGGASDPCAGQPGSGGDQTLTGQLSQCGGVLTPPSTGDDAGASVPDPNPNTTPVVPPQAVPDQAPNGQQPDSSTQGG